MPNFRPVVGFGSPLQRVKIHPSARRHGVADADIEHAGRYALSIYDQDDDTRVYLGPARSADLLEVVTIVRDDGL